MDQRWIFLVLERAGVPQTLRLVLRGIYNDSITSVEHAGAACGQFNDKRCTLTLPSEWLLVHRGLRPLSTGGSHVSCPTA